MESSVRPLHMTQSCLVIYRSYTQSYDTYIISALLLSQFHLLYIFIIDNEGLAAAGTISKVLSVRGMHTWKTHSFMDSNLKQTYDDHVPQETHVDETLVLTRGQVSWKESIVRGVGWSITTVTNT